MSGQAGPDRCELAGALSSARDGDERGFAVLWRALQPALLRYLRVVVGDAAEDVASETWLQVARDLPGYRGDADKFSAWVFAIARNRALDERRRAGRRPDDHVDVSVLVSRPSGEDTAQDAVERLDTERALGLIATLPPDQAEAVMLRVVAGLDAKQAASVLGKRPGAVRVAAMRGLRGLARRLDEGSPAAGPEAATRAGRSTPAGPMWEV